MNSVEMILLEVRDELRGLREDLAGRQRGRLSREDHSLLTEILPVIADAVPIHFRAFNVRELVEHARLPVGARLRDAIGAVGGANRLGRLLKRGAGCEINGWVAECLGKDRDGLVWSVHAATDRVDRRTV